MSSTGRKRDVIWVNFEEVKSDKRKGIRAKCKTCNAEMEGQVARMKKHMAKCDINLGYHSEDSTTTDLSLPSTSSAITSMGTDSKQVKRKRDDNTLDSFVIKSTPAQRLAFDEKIARFVYATNTPFRHVEHPEFIKMVESLRPGYFPPNRDRIGGELLDSTFIKERQKCRDILKNSVVTLGLDGWSNIHNEPVICVTVTTKNGDTFLTDTIDTSGMAHTAENLYTMAKNSILKCELDFECFVGSVVSDNTGNVKKMRDLLENDSKCNVITYGCSAHILNLLGNDIDYPNVREQVIQIIKYFRNNKFASACYRKEANSPKLTLPSEVRWNSFADSLEKYLKAWATLVRICDSNRDEIDNTVRHLVSNISLKRSAEHYLAQLKPIAVALDKTQRSNCTIGETVRVFKDMKNTLESLKLNKDTMQKVDKRQKMALTPAHLLSYLLDPRIKDDNLELSPEEKKEALEYCKNRFPNNSLLILVLKFCAQSSPFQKYLFEDDFTKELSPIEWWQCQKAEIIKFNDKVFTEIELILTAKSTTADVERIFSSFGLVQSKLRNRLGIEKAAKLVFLFKMLNS